MTVTVIIPSTGSPESEQAIESVLNQTCHTQCYVVCDGNDYQSKVKRIVEKFVSNNFLKVCYLPINVGANGFYGHRVYAAFSHLVNTDYVLFLDQDNWFDKNHVESCVDLISKNGLSWCYSLRKIADKQGNYICNDDCESLGKWPTYHGVHHIDTNSYCIKTDVLTKLASAWHGGWGQDRVFFSTIAKHFPHFDCTKEYTTNYRVDGNAGSVTADFFKNGNAVMTQKYNGNFPWNKN